MIKLPKTTNVNKFIAKTKFYQHKTLSAKLKNEFINKIQKITWKHKLAEDTININKTEKVTEIQIFEIELKQQSIPKNVLKIIDKSIPYQILYKFVYQNNHAYGITLKNLTTTNNSTTENNYYLSDWNQTMNFDFTGINLEKVYEKLIKAFIQIKDIDKLEFSEIIQLDKTIKQLEKEISTLESKIKNEKQFNRKVELNKSLLMQQNKLQKIHAKRLDHNKQQINKNHKDKK